MPSFLTEFSNNVIKPVHTWSLKRINRPVGDLLVVAGIYFGLSLLSTWPLPLHLTEAVPGPPYQDQYQNLWNLWWAKFSLFNLHSNPFHSDYIFYPYGAGLYLHTLDLANGLLSLPFQIFNLVFAYNLVLFLALVLTGLATYLFAVELGLSRPGAFMAGILMIFSPVHFHYIKGEIEFASIGWFILYLWLLVKMGKTGPSINWRYILAGGLLIAVIGYTSAYQLVWLGFTNLFWLLKEGWARRAGLKSWVITWVGGWASGLLFLSPLLVGGLLEFAAGKVQAEESLTYLNGAGVRLSSFVVPHYYNPLLTNNSLFNFLTNGSDLTSDDFFLGFSILILAALGIYFYWRLKEKISLGFWLWTGLVFGVLSLGPELYIGRDGTGIPLPYRLFLELPFSRIVRNSARFSEVMLLGLALAGGFGFQQLLSRPWLSRFKSARTLLSIFIGLLLLLEFWKLPYPANEIKIPAAYYSLKGSGAVLELPLNEHDLSDAPAMFYQTFHRRPILPAYLSRRPVNPYERENTPLNLLVWRANKPDIFSLLPPENALNYLGIQGIGTIVLHRNLDPSAGQEEDYLVKVTKKQPYYRDNEISLFEVTPGPAGPAFVLGAGWYDAEKISETEGARWFNQAADFDVYSVKPGEVTFDFKAVAFNTLQHLKILVNNHEVAALDVLPEIGAYRLKIKLEQGQNRVDLIAQEPPLSPREAGQGNDGRKLNVQIRQLSLTYIEP